MPAPASPAGERTGLGNIGITADERNNALVILATPQQYASVEAALKESIRRRYRCLRSGQSPK